MTQNLFIFGIRKRNKERFRLNLHGNLELDSLLTRRNTRSQRADRHGQLAGWRSLLISVVTRNRGLNAQIVRGCYGKRVWMMASIPKEYRAGPDDLIKPYVLLTNTHDGSQALRMIPTTVRVVCQNTLNLALRESGVEGLTISHHPRLESRIAEARAKLGIIAARFDKFDDELHAMLAKKLTVTEAGGYFRGLTGADLPHGTDRQKKTREKVLGQMLDNFDNDKNTLPGVKHTAWGAYNAVSEWADHQRKFRGGSPADKLDRQLDSVWFGQSHQIKQAAYRGALELAGVL